MSDNTQKSAKNAILTAFNDLSRDFDEAKLRRYVEKL